MKPIVIYHANCTDGFGAAFAAWLKLGNEAESTRSWAGSRNPSPPLVSSLNYFLECGTPDGRHLTLGDE